MEDAIAWIRKYLILGTTICVSSSSWFTAWIGLEINLISIAPILINKISFQSVESSIKYFLIQAIASSILIISFFLNRYFYIFSLAQFTELIITICLILKAGVAPLHFWFPQIIIYLNWIQCLILLTWQKIAPFILLSFINNIIIFYSIIFSSIVGLIGGINQTNLKLILTYSSIIHSSWILRIIMCNETLWCLYLIIYMYLTVSVTFIFFKNNTFIIESIFSIKINHLHKLIFLINFLSIAGLPPFLGFIIKIIALITIIKYNLSIILIITLISSSFLSFYFYSRLIYSSLFLYKTPQTFINKSPLNYFLISLTAVFSTITRFSIPLFMLIY